MNIGKEKTALKCSLPLASPLHARHRSKINALEPSSDCSALRQLTMDAALNQLGGQELATNTAGLYSAFLFPNDLP